MEKTARYFLTVLVLLALLASSACAKDLRPGFGTGDLIPVDCSKGHDLEVVHADKASCTTKGKIYSRCSRCGKEITDEIPALGHDMQKAGYSSPSCEKDGYTLYKCSRCGVEERYSEPAFGHSGYTKRVEPTCKAEGKVYIECDVCGKEIVQQVLPTIDCDYVYTTLVEGNCGKTGKQEQKCKNCGTTIINYIQPTRDHNYYVVSENKATCTNYGVKFLKCAVCGDQTEQYDMQFADHKWQETYYEPATCAADGYRSYKCTVCSQDKIETIPATGNCTWGEWIVAVNATCDEDGLKVTACSVCGDKKEQKIPAIGHIWSTPTVTNPTCTAAGSKVTKCTRCGETKTETLKALGHDWKDGNIIKAATCTEDGVATSVCTRCNTTDNNRTLPKLGHKWGSSKVIKAATCTEAGTKQAVCSVCGEKQDSTIKATGHDWGAWKIVVEATSSVDGTRERVCQTCGTKDTAAYKAEATAAPQATKKPSSSGSSKTSAKLEAEYGTVEVFTTSGKVNIRSGPSMNKGRVTQVEKRNTCLGELLDAQADNKGVVWYKVKYKGKNGWITSEFSKAVVGELDGRARRAEGKKIELSSFYLKSVDEAVEALGLEEDYQFVCYETEASNGAVFVGGNDYAEYIILTDEGYTMFGAKVGERYKDAQKKLKKANLVFDFETAGEYTYQVICSPDSLSVNEYGFDGTLYVYTDSDGKIESITLEAYVP